MRKIMLAAAAVLGAVALIAGYASRRADAGPSSSTYVGRAGTVNVEAVQVTGANGRQMGLVRSALTGFTGHGFIKTIEFGAAPEPFTDKSDTVWMSVTVAPPDEGGNMLAYWQAEQVASAAHDAFADAGLPDLAGLSVQSVLPDGTSRRLPAFVMEYDPPPPATGDPAAAVARAAAQAGMRVDGTETFTPRGQAVAAVVTTDDPYGFVKGSARSVYGIIGQAGAASDGVYLEVRNEDGELVSTTATVTRLGGASHWTAPTYRAAVPNTGPTARSLDRRVR